MGKPNRPNLRSRRISAEIEEIAAAYCDGQQDPILYQHAIALGQCDHMIAELRLQSVRLIDSLSDLAPMAEARLGPFAGGDILAASDPQQNYTTTTAIQFDWDAFQRALPYVDRLNRIEQHIWSRRSRALKMFVAAQKRLTRSEQA